MHNEDPDELLKALNNAKNHYLTTKTTQNIIKEKYDALNMLTDDKTVIDELMTKLTPYRYVDVLDEIHIGKPIRWIQKYAEDIYLTNGGIAVKTEFTDDGVNIFVKLFTGRVNQIRFDDCLIFQKMSFDEQLILYASDIVNK